MQLAPHLVEPLAAAIPTFGNGLRGKLAMRIALMANDMISWDRNRGLEESRPAAAREDTGSGRLR